MGTCLAVKVASAPDNGQPRRQARMDTLEAGHESTQGGGSLASTCTHLEAIQTDEASGEGCVECLASGGTWLHLRRCATCGHVGCCDSSPNRHATAHFPSTRIRSCSRSSRARNGSGATSTTSASNSRAPNLALRIPEPARRRRRATCAGRHRGTPPARLLAVRDVLRHDLRLPDERPRLGAHQGACSRSSGWARRRAPRRPTSSSSTPARSVRSPTPKLSAYLGEAIARKRRDPERVIAVGGCFAEAQRERIFELYPEVDVAFGPGSIAHLGDWLGAGGVGVARGASGSRSARSPRRCRRIASAPSRPGCRSRWAATRSAPTASSRPYAAASAAAGRARSLAEVTPARRARASSELTLLGQNVNSYGRDLAPELRTEFGELLRACDAVAGIERIRFTSPHPKDFREPVIAAIAECAAVCEHVHLPLQSGSTRVLKAMRAPTAPSATSRSSSGCAPRSPTSRSAPTSSSASRARRDEDFARDARSSSRRSASTAPTPSSTRRARAPRRRRCPPRCRTSSRSSGWSGSSSCTQRHRQRAQPRTRRPGRGGARRGPLAHRRGAAARPDAAQHDRQLQRQRRRRALVAVAITGATSMTLRGRARRRSSRV